MGLATALRGADPFAEHAAEDSPESTLTAIGDVLGDEAGEPGYTEVRELLGVTRFGERMDLASGPAGTDGPAVPPTDPLPTGPAPTDRTPAAHLAHVREPAGAGRTADALADGVRVLHDHPIPEPGRTLAELRERTRE
ncbi:hypothetical protein [Actinacidiphila sp. bgisy160]|uniref:hypothetical protein n=1 Tax=Actinacidiphila sp. bgisy160 TaxID=3413796 RepID=UPI003D75FACE